MTRNGDSFFLLSNHFDDIMKNIFVYIFELTRFWIMHSEICICDFDNAAIAIYSWFMNRLFDIRLLRHPQENERIDKMIQRTSLI